MGKYKDRETGEEFGYLKTCGGFVTLIPMSQWNDMSPFEELVWKVDLDKRFEKLTNRSKEAQDE